MHHRRVAIAQQDIGPGPLFEHEGKILTSHDQSRLIALTRNRARHISGKLSLRLMVDHRGVIPIVVHPGRAPKHRRSPFANLGHALFGQIAHFRRHGADGAHDLHLLRDHVKGFGRRLKRCDRDDDPLNRVRIAADDALQRRDRMGRHQGRIDSLLRLGGMSAKSLKFDGQQIRRGKKHAGPDRKRAHRHTGPIVQPINLVDLPAIHHPVPAHLTAATATLFGRLKDHDGSTIEIPRFREVTRRPQKHRSMTVMTTSMHRPVRLGRVVQPGFLMDRQRIHIRAQADDLARRIRAALDHAHDARAPDPFDHFITAKVPQLFRHQRAGAVGLKQNFRVFVNVTSPRRDIGLHFGKSVLNRHLKVLCLAPRLLGGHPLFHNFHKPAAPCRDRIIIKSIFGMVQHGPVPVAQHDVRSGPLV
mmetsp:Transcript_22895/g.38369  ORF Transcript_22895/g.38369 Transcript_22895/m.38369 type:complete len:417 (-) Transcript_22895:1332-2582(-)